MSATLATRPPVLAPADLERAARTLGATPAIVGAVLEVETGGAGGFLADGRPRILFEAHLFSRDTARRWDARYPAISAQPWNRMLYRGGAGEWPRLDLAASLDETAALRSASWGLAQILGRNHRACGYTTVQAYVAAMREGEGRQLDALVAFLIFEGLAIPLRQKHWAVFAERYNGPGYRANAYDDKLAKAHARLAGAPPPKRPIATMLSIGDRGDAVRRVQRALVGVGYVLTADGVFGRVTEVAVQHFQEGHGLAPDGVVGPATAAALEA